ncbi:hypothetical protein M8C21_012075, partial [Ambrosia artemisiifolia]
LYVLCSYSCIDKYVVHLILHSSGKMEFVTPVITAIVQSLMEPVKKHMGFFFSSTKHVTNMTEKLTELNEAKGVMEEKKNDALRNDQFIPDTLPGPSTSETAHDYDVTRNIFPSRLSIFNGVLKSLEHDSETQMMAICGMGGVGKTTMMEDIMKEVKNRGMFKWVVKVVIGTKYNPIATQENIAKQTGSGLTEDTIDARADRLRNRFEHMLKCSENILVIMDDVWEAINLKDIGLASPIPKGFKLLVTSRNEKVCIKMDIETNSIFKMVGLEEQEANSFFWETVRISDEDSERCTIGKDILNRCGGLPIAIKTIALALRSEDVYAWQVAQKSLQRHNLEDIEDLDGVASFVSQGEKSEWPKQDTNCERFLLQCQKMTEFPYDFYYPNLALMKLMSRYMQCQFAEDFHKRMEKLEVIAYEGLCNPLFLVSLQCSISLRTLCLYSCSLVDSNISFLGDLVNLEVLSIANCDIRKLPCTIRNLKRLKLLDLTGCVDLCIDDGVFQNLNKLEELYMRVDEGKPIRFTESNCDEFKMLSMKLNALEFEFFKNVLQPKNVSLEKLQRFRISMGCFLRVPYGEEYISKNTLKLETNCNELLECKINVLFSKTEELRLSVKDMSYVEDILVSLPRHSTFYNLKILHIFKCENLRYLFEISTANGLKQLESLTVSSCPVLKSLVSLCDSAVVMKLPQLVELNLHDLPNFTSIIPENDISATSSLLNKEVVFSKLSKIKVDGLKNLKRLWACDITNCQEHNVSMLREIEVIGCDCLVNLFPKNPMRLLSHLEELKVKRCCSIEVLFNIDLGKFEQLKCNSNLRRIMCENLEELREVWMINEENYSDYHIGGFEAVETIKIRMCKKFRNVFTPTTANFAIGALKDITIVFNSGEESKVEITGISKMQEISKYDGNMSIVSFPSYHLKHTFHDLRKICFEGFKGAEVMFDMEYPSINRELVPTLQQQPSPLLPCLEELELSFMDKLNHVWKCNKWNEFFILYKNQPQSSFQNLTTISLSKCKSMKYLFSPLMSKLLSNLKTIYINLCEGMEEVVSNRDDDDDDQEEVLTTSTTTLFPCLSYIKLDSLHNLKRIGGVAKGKTNVTHDQFKKLQELHISSCRSMVEVFETKEINNDGCSSTSVDPGSVPLQRSNNSIMHHELTNLKILKIFECDLLEYVFTFSTLESLKKLETLSIKNCKEMKVIVREENGDETSKVVLPRLKSIELKDLPNLAGFFLGMNINFQLPSLDYVKISKCPKMTLFTSGDSTAPKLEYIHTCLGKHNLESGLNFHQHHLKTNLPSEPKHIKRINPPFLSNYKKKFHTPSPNSPSSSLCPPTTEGTFLSFHNLIEMDVAYNHELKKIVPSSELLQLQNLRKVSVRQCINVEEVFEVASEVTNNETQTVVTFPNLKEVELQYLDSLKYIWKSNQWVTLEFPNLTILYIFDCKSLEYVFTASMVGSLKQLQKLLIGACNRMETIVKKEEGCDGEVSEIVLPCLKFLKLICLASLKGFCLGKENITLPSLNTLQIYGCPEIRVFSEGSAIAPELKLVQTNRGFFQTEEDINSFIITKKQEGNIFGEPPRTMNNENIFGEILTLLTMMNN